MFNKTVNQQKIVNNVQIKKSVICVTQNGIIKLIPLKFYQHHSMLDVDI